MNKLVLLLLALCITFVFAKPKLSGPFPNNRRKPVLSARQNFCEAGNGFHADKLRKIKETRIFPSDNSYYCYLGCFCTETKSIMTGDKFLSEKYIDIALTRTLSQQDSDNLISKCKYVKVAKDVCEAGKTIHNCFAAQKIILADFIGYVDGEEV